MGGVVFVTRSIGSQEAEVGDPREERGSSRRKEEEVVEGERTVDSQKECVCVRKQKQADPRKGSSQHAKTNGQSVDGDELRRRKERAKGIG